MDGGCLVFKLDHPQYGRALQIQKPFLWNPHLLPEDRMSAEREMHQAQRLMHPPAEDRPA